MQETVYKLVKYQITEVLYDQTTYSELSDAIEAAQQAMMDHPEDGIHVRKYVREVP